MKLAVKQIVNGTIETKYQEKAQIFSFGNVQYTPNNRLYSLPVLGVVFNGSSNANVGVDGSMLNSVDEGGYIGLKIQVKSLRLEGYLHLPGGATPYAESIPKYARMIVYKNKISAYPIGEDANTAITNNNPANLFRSTQGGTAPPTGLLDDMYATLNKNEFVIYSDKVHKLTWPNWTQNTNGTSTDESSGITSIIVEQTTGVQQPVGYHISSKFNIDLTKHFREISFPQLTLGQQPSANKWCYYTVLPCNADGSVSVDAPGNIADVVCQSRVKMYYKDA